MSCGCNDTALPLQNCNPCADCPPTNAINLPPCIGGEACEEVNQTDCIQYTGPNLPALGINMSDRLITILTKLHKVVNALLPTPIPISNFTLTNTDATTTPAPFVVSYLGLGPIYLSTVGTAVGVTTSTTITVGSTTGLAVGMTVSVASGTGSFAAGTTVSSIVSTTQFVVSLAPTVNLSTDTVIKAVGSVNTIYSASVVVGTPQTIQAFAGSVTTISGTGTIV